MRGDESEIKFGDFFKSNKFQLCSAILPFLWLLDRIWRQYLQKHFFVGGDLRIFGAGYPLLCLFKTF